MKLRNSKKAASEDVSKFSKRDDPSEVGLFVKRKVARTIEKSITSPVKEIKTKKSSLSTNIDKKSTSDDKSNIESSVIFKALDVLQQLSQISSEKRMKLFDENKSIILQIECIKIPDCVSRKLRFNLPHWLVTDSSEICLFVTDLKKGRKVDHEPTVQHYEDLLREKGITMIKSVIPIRQVRVEYDQMEMKRRLLTQFDFFLADAKVSGLLAHKLGTTFYRKNQLPTPVRMDSKDLKKAIETALHKTVMKLHGTGHTYSLHVANGQHSTQQAFENIQAVLLQLVDQFPGGWSNIRSLHLKHPLSMSLPIYMTLKNQNSVDNVVIKPLHSGNDVVEDELSTILGAKVKVSRKGDVEIEINKSEDECSDNSVSPPKKTKIDSVSNKTIGKKNLNKKLKNKSKSQSSLQEPETSNASESESENECSNNSAILPKKTKTETASKKTKDLQKNMKNSKPQIISQKTISSNDSESESEDDDESGEESSKNFEQSSIDDDSVNSNDIADSENSDELSDSD